MDQDTVGKERDNVKFCPPPVAFGKCFPVVMWCPWALKVLKNHRVGKVGTDLQKSKCPS